MFLTVWPLCLIWANYVWQTGKTVGSSVLKLTPKNLCERLSMHRSEEMYLQFHMYQVFHIFFLYFSYYTLFLQSICLVLICFYYNFFIKGLGMPYIASHRVFKIVHCKSFSTQVTAFFIWK